ncbi:MAG: hypothetical protein BWK73_05870 [Thiothrix lacustris]|uniref:Urease accessory protein UreJ n=1 Tax=Thiothrix lacustris TaxID=525917 RepID=A0A1Y1QWW5_9GAMM|nr:MAG: hypothetical protein BWK73_05870 [Thiothrix lacustris]
MKRILTTVALLLSSGIAVAHTGHDVHGFSSGLMHPIGGMDHLLAMLAVGLWSAAVMPRQLWAAPAAFMGLMLVGAMLGVAGVTLPLLEPGIALSVVIMGLLLIGLTRLGAAPALALIGVFALFHGNAHGAEAPLGGSVALYMAGFLISTGLLHLAGVGIGTTVMRTAQVWALRVIGGGMGVAGLWLLLAS